MALISPEEIANEIGLATDELSNSFDYSIIPSLSDCFSQWRVIFGSLLSELDLGDVDRENSTEKEKRIAALRKWKTRNGCEATYKVLVDALLNKGERYEAQSLCKILADHSSNKNETTTADCDAKNSESDIRFECPCGKCLLETYLQKGCPKSYIPYHEVTTLSEEDQEDLYYILRRDTKEIMKNFAYLSNRTCDSLIRRGVTIEKVVKVAVTSNSSLHDQLTGSTSIDRVFTELAPEMSFFNHETLAEIINELGDPSDKDRLADYSKKFNEFCKRKFFEVEPGLSGYYASKLKQKKPFAVVLLADEKTVLQKLGDAVNIKVMLSKVLGVPPATLHLHRIDGGNITLVFSVPDSIAKELFPLPKKKIDSLKAKGMVLFVPQDLKYEVEDVLACSTDMHEPSSKHTSTVSSGALRKLLVSHSLPASVQLGPRISISSTTPQGEWSTTAILGDDVEGQPQLSRVSCEAERVWTQCEQRLRNLN